MALFEVGLFVILAFICIFALVDRICKCIEYRSATQAFAACQKSVDEWGNFGKLIKAFADKDQKKKGE